MSALQQGEGARTPHEQFALARLLLLPSQTELLGHTGLCPHSTCAGSCRAACGCRMIPCGAPVGGVMLMGKKTPGRPCLDGALLLLPCLSGPSPVRAGGCSHIPAWHRLRHRSRQLPCLAAPAQGAADTSHNLPSHATNPFPSCPPPVLQLPGPFPPTHPSPASPRGWQPSRCPNLGDCQGPK